MTGAKPGAVRAFDRLLVVLAAIALWQAIFIGTGGVALTSPVATAGYLGELAQGDVFWENLRVTATELVWSLVIAYGGGVAIGTMLGNFRFAGRVFEPIIVAISAVPKVTLYPVLLLVFGLGISAKIAFGALHGIIPVTLFTMSAIRNIDPVHIKTAQVLRLSRWRRARYVLLPAVLPQVFTGLRLGFSLSMLGVLMGEMFASQSGVGFVIMNGMQIADHGRMTAMIALVVTFALLANTVLLAIDRSLHRGRAAP